MPLFPRLLISAICTAGLLFCCFGFMATFEPLDRPVQITWRVVYGIGGILMITMVVVLNRPRKQAANTE